jgi:hypothetical protein
VAQNPPEILYNSINFYHILKIRGTWRLEDTQQAALQGSLTTKLPWTRLAHLPVLTDQNDVLIECII